MSTSRGGRGRRRPHEDHDEHPSEAWLIALADMMTLLMVTFLMMFAISNMDLQKFKTFQRAFAQGTGSNLPDLPGEGVPTVGAREGATSAASVVSSPPAEAEPPPDRKVLDVAALTELQKKIQSQLEAARLDDRVQATIDPKRGLVLYVTSGVLFASGEADVTATGRALLDGIAPILRTVGNTLVVEGHTDSRPISSSRFPSNWELSSSRASAVARGLMDDGVERKRISVAGYADTRPRKDLANEQAFAANRRVEVVIEAPKPTVVIPAVVPSGAAAPAAPTAAGG